MIKVNAKKLREAIQVSGYAKKSTMPIMKCVKLNMIEFLIWVEGTDLDCITRSAVPLTWEGDTMKPRNESLVVEAVLLLRAIEGATDYVWIEFDDKRITVRDAFSQTTMERMLTEDFPVSFMDSEYSYYGEIGLPVEKFLDTAKRTMYAMASLDVRYYLNGMCLEFSKSDGARLIATDGHRMVVSELGFLDTAKYVTDGDMQYIIPRASVERLVSVCGKHKKGRVSLKVTKPSGIVADVFSKTGDIVAVLEMKTIDGKFPDYRRILDGTKNYTQWVNFAPHYVAELMVRFGKGIKSPIVKAEIYGNGVDFSSAGSKATIKASAIINKPLRAGINPKYLFELCDNFPAQDISIGIGDDRDGEINSALIAKHTGSETCFPQSIVVMTARL